MPCKKCGHTVSETARYCEQCGAEVLQDVLTEILNEEQINLDEWDLHRAAFENEFKIAQLLINRGAQVNSRNEHDQTPLHQATHMESVQVAKLLIENGADVNAIETRKGSGAYVLQKDGEEFKITPLTYATHGADIQVMQLLLEHGADVANTESFHGDPILHWAMTPDQAQLLIKHGADVNAKNNQGCTALNCFTSSKDTDPNLEAVQILLNHGADVNTNRTYGDTPLHDVFSGTNSIDSGLKAARLLVRHGADIEAKNKEGGERPLHMAIKSNRVKWVQFLIECGADVNAKSRLRGQDRPLKMAVHFGHRNIARLLLKSGAKYDGIAPSWLSEYR